MPYDSRDDLSIRLAEVRVEIAKARKVQSYSVGQDLSVVRGQLKTLLDEEKWLLSQIDKIDATASGGASNKVRFGRPS
ncbi:MAG: hypothetical protein RBT11_19135 [Desulfobacterales bacterium]|jgi:hypothetical protein|nr:hypothetical protein [Desulfobacterales bacterium]